MCRQPRPTSWTGGNWGFDLGAVIELTPTLESILASAYEADYISTGDPQDPDFTALVSAGYLELTDDWSGWVKITKAGRERLKHGPA